MPFRPSPIFRIALILVLLVGGAGMLRPPELRATEARQVEGIRILQVRLMLVPQSDSLMGRPEGFQVQLNWAEEPGQMYIVRWARDPSMTAALRTANVSGSQYLIDNLAYGRTYYIQVEDRPGKRSIPVAVAGTYVRSMASHAQGLGATPGRYTLNVEWLPVMVQQGAELAYILEWSDDSLFSHPTGTATVPEVNQYDVPDLLPGKDYYFRVKPIVDGQEWDNWSRFQAGLNLIPGGLEARPVAGLREQFTRGAKEFFWSGCGLLWNGGGFWDVSLPQDRPFFMIFLTAGAMLGMILLILIGGVLGIYRLAQLRFKRVYPPDHLVIRHLGLVMFLVQACILILVVFGWMSGLDTLLLIGWGLIASITIDVMTGTLMRRTLAAKLRRRLEIAKRTLVREEGFEAFEINELVDQLLDLSQSEQDIILVAELFHSLSSRVHDPRRDVRETVCLTGLVISLQKVGAHRQDIKALLLSAMEVEYLSRPALMTIGRLNFDDDELRLRIVGYLQKPTLDWTLRWAAADALSYSGTETEVSVMRRVLHSTEPVNPILQEKVVDALEAIRRRETTLGMILDWAGQNVPAFLDHLTIGKLLLFLWAVLDPSRVRNALCRRFVDQVQAIWTGVLGEAHSREEEIEKRNQLSQLLVLCDRNLNYPIALILQGGILAHQGRFGGHLEARSATISALEHSFLQQEQILQQVLPVLKYLLWILLLLGFLGSAALLQGVLGSGRLFAPGSEASPALILRTSVVALTPIIVALFGSCLVGFFLFVGVGRWSFIRGDLSGIAGKIVKHL